MRRNFLGPAWTIFGLALSVASLQANVVDSDRARYQTIPERNVFGLTAPSVSRTEAPAPPLPQVTLTGITTILGDKRALLKTKPVQTKGGPSSAEDSMILAEGQRAGPLEVLTIDETAGKVKIKNLGTLVTLTFEANGPKPVAVPPPPPFGLPGAAAGVPGFATNNAGVTPTPQFRLPIRPYATPGAGPGSIPGAAGVPPLPPTGAGPVPATTAAQALDVPDLTPEEQAIVQRLRDPSATPPATISVTPPAFAPPGTVTAPSGAKLPDTVPPAVPQPIPALNMPNYSRPLSPQ